MMRIALPLLTSATALTLVAVPATAQTPTPAAGTTRVTVEGCLSKDDRPERSSAATQFVLTDQQAPPPPAATGGTSAGAMTAGPITVKKAYTLRSDLAGVNLQAHVGQRVRVTGTSTGPSTSAPLAGRSPEATPHPAPAGPPGSTGSDFDTANLPTLVVASITALGGTCK